MNQKQKKPNADSLFGALLTQAFMGVVLGPVAAQAMQTAEICSTVYTDRFTQRTRPGLRL